MNRIPLNIFLFFTALYMITASGHMYVRDELTRYEVTRAIVEHGALAIEQGDGDIARDGRLYGKYGLGQSILAIPFYTAGRAVQKVLFPSDPYVAQLGACFFNSVVTGLIAALLFVFLARMGHEPRTAFTTVLLYGTCTMAWPYTQTFFTEPLASLFLLGAAYCLVFKAASWRADLAAGALLGGAFLTRADTALAIFVFGVLLFLRFVKRPAAPRFAAMVAAAAPLAAAVGLQLLYNWWRFGNLLNFGYRGESFTSPLLEGLFGQLFSTGKGLVFFSPAVIVAAAGFAHLVRRSRAAAFLCAAPFAASVFMYSRWNLWGGDLSWGPRYLVSFLPLAMLPAAEFIARMNQGAAAAKKTLLAAVVAAALCVNALALAVNFHVYTDLLMMTVDRFGDSDRMMQNIYFNPRFSPMAGHAEMLRLMAAGDEESRLFNPDGDAAVDAAIAKHKVLDFWWAIYLDKYRDSAARRMLVLGVLAMIGAALAVSGLWLWRGLAAAPGKALMPDQSG